MNIVLEITLMSKTFMTYFPLWNTKGDISPNVQAALFHKTKICVSSTESVHMTIECFRAARFWIN